MAVYIGLKGQRYITQEPFLGKGGEGAVYALQNTPTLVAKIYNAKCRTDGRHRKISAMLTTPIDAKARDQVTWPLDVLYENGRFVGYVMPRLTMSENLNAIYDPNGKYRHTGLDSRIEIAKNLCAAVNAVHNAGQVCGDFNPKNINVNPKNGLVTLVDTDSYHITGTGGQVHRCEVGLPEYLPREVQAKMKNGFDLANAPLPTYSCESDYFALAVHIFALIMNGTHPFAIASKGSQGSTTNPKPEENIVNGDTPFFKNIRGFGVPIYAPAATMLPPQLHELFRRAFVDGHNNPKARPSPVEWYHALESSSVNLTMCRTNPAHKYFPHNASCPYCDAQQRMRTFSGPISQSGSIISQKAIRINQPIGSGSPHRNAASPAKLHNASNSERLMAAVGYLVFPVPMLSNYYKNSGFVRHHVIQGIPVAVLVGLAILFSFVPAVGAIITTVLSLAAGTSAAIGIVHAAKGEMKPLPVLDNIVKSQQMQRFLRNRKALLGTVIGLVSAVALSAMLPGIAYAIKNRPARPPQAVIITTEQTTVPVTTTQIQTTTEAPTTPAPTVVSLSALPEFWRQGKGNWGVATFTDNEGYEHRGWGTDFMGDDGEGRWSETGDAIAFLLDSKYTRLEGKLCLLYHQRNTDAEAVIHIYTDDELAYTSAILTKGVKPIAFSVDVTSAAVLIFKVETIKEVPVIQGGVSLSGPAFGIEAQLSDELFTPSSTQQDTLFTTVPPTTATPRPKTIDDISPAVIKTLSGSIRAGQTDTYPLKAVNSGSHRIDISGMPEGMRISVGVYNAGGGYVGGGQYTNGYGFNANLTAGQAYEIRVSQNNGEPSYTLTIGCPTATVDIADNTVIKDSIKFGGQQNTYTFTVPETGSSRIDISGMPEGMRISVGVYNAGGGYVGGGQYSNGYGFNANLTAGQTYELRVSQNNGLPDYIITLNYPNPPKEASIGESVIDALRYAGQQNTYSFIAQQTGNHKIDVSGMREGMRISVGIYNAGGGYVGGGQYSNGYGFNVNLTAGQTYQVRVSQNSQIGNYTFRISMNAGG